MAIVIRNLRVDMVKLLVHRVELIRQGATKIMRAFLPGLFSCSSDNCVINVILFPRIQGSLNVRENQKENSGSCQDE
jgi:hypothetical protein